MTNYCEANTLRSKNYYLPPELHYLIKQYSMPLTKPDYKRGSYLIRTLVYDNDVISFSIFKLYIEANTLRSKNIKELARVLNDGKRRLGSGRSAGLNPRGMF